MNSVLAFYFSFVIHMCCITEPINWVPVTSWEKPENALRIVARSANQSGVLFRLASLSRQWPGHKVKEIKIIEVPMVFVSKRSFLFHVKGCSLIIDELGFTEVPFYEAILGTKIPCSICKPLDVLGVH